jgi:hypothetical protein
MERSIFEREMKKAKAFISVGERPDYWAGYQRGLRQRYHGEEFGKIEEHELWMSLKDDKDPIRADRGQGYRDGYIPEYCRKSDTILKSIRPRY